MKELLEAIQLPRNDLGEVLQANFIGGGNPLTIRVEKATEDSVNVT